MLSLGFFKRLFKQVWGSFFLALITLWLLVHFNSVSQSCLTLCDPVDCSPPVLPVLHHLPECAQTHIHRVGDAIQPSHPLSSPPPAFNPFPHWALFQWVSSSHQMAKVLELQPQHQSFQWTFRTDFLYDRLGLLSLYQNIIDVDWWGGGAIFMMMSHHFIELAFLWASVGYFLFLPLKTTMNLRWRFPFSHMGG